MSSRSGLVGVAVPLAGLVLCCGCAGLLTGEGVRRVPGLDGLGVDARMCVAEPAVASDVARRLPGAGYSTIYANGMAWIGYNVATAEGGDLGVYDNGEGAAFGIAFGDGQNLKRFFEIGYEETGGHEATSGGVTSKASHERYYAGVRRYIFPVSEDTGGRVVPFFVGGVTYQSLSGSGRVATDSGYVFGAQGAGLYVGTGLEFKLGSSSQVALALDFRGSFIAYDGAPEGGGRQFSVGSAMALILHF
ncbi:MAG: hypothetical protein ACYS9X_27330 [Planctomycetota bacterium]|jgi:hypothetical protein